LLVEKATGLGGAFSAVSLKLAAGSREPAVVAAVDSALAPYGGKPAVGRADQTSHKFQQERIDRLGIIAWVIPPVFLLVAAGLVQMVLSRLVETEREHIGLLKAFGYGDLEASSIYLKMSLLISLIGAAAGAGLGAWMGRAVTNALAQYMRFPHLDVQFSWTAFLVAAAISVSAAAAGSLVAVRRAVRLSPAVAMRPLTPSVYRRGLLEILPGWRRLDQPTRLILRNLQRFWGRAVLTLAGLAVSLSLLVGSQFMFGSLDEVLDQAYFRARHWTDFIGFSENRDIHAIAEVARLPGVLTAEPARFAPVRVRAHGREQKGFVTGIDADARLSLALTPAGRSVPVKGGGVILSSTLAYRLGVRPGDVVELEITEGRRPIVALPVTDIALDYAGLSLFMVRSELNRLMGDGDVVSSAVLQLADDRRPAFYRAIERAPQIVSTASRADTVAAYRTTEMQVLTVEMTFFAGFAAAIAFGVAYNVSRIALSERGRDLATLRVMGFGPLECAYVLIGELLVLALLAAPLGVAGGVGLAKALVAAFAGQDMQLPMIIAPRSYGVAISTYLAAVAAAAALVGARIWSLDLVAVLKTRE
jgi:putative ABC transport system permease protein